MIRNPIAQAFIDRLKDYRTSATGSLGRLSAWLEKNTSMHQRAFSFKHHEYQRAICDDTSYSMCCIKPSQCGLSELTVRMVLGFLGTNASTSAIYGLQTVMFASTFFKSRVDPVIRESKFLRNMVLAASDSAKFKEFSNGSQLHGAGFSQGTAIISIPASMVISDETDFSDPSSIATAESRLSHAPFVDPETGVRGIRRYFSTPTVEDWGVSGLFAKSDKKRRLVKCKHCREWYWPNLLEQGIIKGWDKVITELTAVDLVHLDNRGLLSSAQILCPKCHNPMTKQNLGPDHREWVAESPHVLRLSGWQVSPFDLPEYHSAESLFRKLIELTDLQINHWYNFALGLPYSDSSNSVAKGAVDNNKIVTPIPPEIAETGGISGCVAGIDIGKISWITIGKVINNTLHVVWCEQIRLRDEDGGDLKSRVLYLLAAYKVIVAVSDALPYSDVILEMVAARPGFKAAEYSIRDKTLPMVMCDMENSEGDNAIVKMNRTKTLSYLVKRINSNQIKFPVMDETDLVGSHLKSLKQIERVKDNGETVKEWVSTGPDHYGHSLNYLNTAATLSAQVYSSGIVVPVSLRSVEVGSKYTPPEATTPARRSSPLRLI